MCIHPMRVRRAYTDTCLPTHWDLPILALPQLRGSPSIYESEVCYCQIEMVVCVPVDSHQTHCVHLSHPQRSMPALTQWRPGGVMKMHSNMYNSVHNTLANDKYMYKHVCEHNTLASDKYMYVST